MITTLVSMESATSEKLGATLQIFESVNEDEYSILVIDASAVLSAADEETSNAVGMGPAFMNRSISSTFKCVF